MMRITTMSATPFPLAPTNVGERAGVRGCRLQGKSSKSCRADGPPHPALSPAEAGARNICEVPPC